MQNKQLGSKPLERVTCVALLVPPHPPARLSLSFFHHICFSCFVCVGSGYGSVNSIGLLLTLLRACNSENLACVLAALLAIVWSAVSCVANAITDRIKCEVRATSKRHRNRPTHVFVETHDASDDLMHARIRDPRIHVFKVFAFVCFTATL